MSCIFVQLLPEKYRKVLAMESRILRKNRRVVLFIREAIEKLAQFQNATENEKNGEKIENTQQKNKKSSLFLMEKNGYEILEGMHPGTSPGKTKTEK